MEAAILAGGKGTRLAGLAPGIPKPLVPVLGKPVLEHQVDALRRSGVTEVTLIVEHLGQQIKDYFGDGRRFGSRVSYFTEASPLGTGGALVLLRDRLPERFIVIYGDLMLDMDFTRLLAFHRQHPGQCTLVVHPNDHPYDSDLVLLGSSAEVRQIARKNEPRDLSYGNCVNAGICVLDRAALDGLPAGPAYDLERDIIEPAVKAGAAYGYRTTEYIKDMGTPGRHAEVARHAASGLVTRRNLRRRQRAIFLDRDGTLNEHVGLVSSPGQLRVPDEVYAGLAAINDSGFLAIVASNQPVVARGLCSLDELNEINRRLEGMLGERNVYVDDLLFCPHHPDRGFPGENRAYKVACACRKPGTALVDSAVEIYNIDRGASYFVGDTTTDIQTGRNAGLRTVLLETGEAGKDGKYAVRADLRAANLEDAAAMILAEAASRPVTSARPFA